MRADELISTAKAEPMERLRWKVLRAFNVLPCSVDAKSMSDEDCLKYAAHMLLDKEGGTAANPNFDMEKYLNTMERENGR